MTVVPRHDYSAEMTPGVRYRFSECSQCGARTEEEAARQCRPQSDPSGEYYCASSEGYMSPAFDLKGRHCTPTNKDLRREARQLDEWINAACEGCGRPNHSCECHR